MHRILNILPIIALFLFPGFLLAKANAEIFRRHMNSYFIETGSYEGEGIEQALAAGFKEVHSIELEPKYYNFCKDKFVYQENVHLWLGDSGAILSQLIESIDEPITFWLDGHWSGEGTAQGESFTPILNELNAIRNHPIKSHTIIIDDIRLFGRWEFDDIPLQQIIDKITEINPEYRISTIDGSGPNDILIAELTEETSRNFVTCEIAGQLANQMFETAAAIAYALDHHCEARFPSLIKAINGDLNIKNVFHRLNVEEFPPDIQFTDFPEQRFYSPIPYEKGEHLRLQGTFVNENYFVRHSSAIRELFAPTEEIRDLIHKKYGRLLNRPTIALHVRTFFPDGIDPNSGVGRTSWDYFLKAIDVFPEEYTLFIFSDCPDWVKDHFPIILRPNVHFVEGNPHYIDFYLMSFCDHQILSPKSTFSWWAAWLNPNPDKIVIRADDGWLDESAYPESWLKISLAP